MWGEGVTPRLEVPVLGLTLTPGPVGEEPNGPRATVTHVGLLTSIKFSYTFSSQCYCFSLILIPFLFPPLWHCFTLLCFILRSPLPYNASIIFHCYLRFVFPFCTLCLRPWSSLLLRIYLRLYFLLFLFSTFRRSFASLSFFILFRFVPLSVVYPFSSQSCYLLLSKMTHSGASRLRINLG